MCVIITTSPSVISCSPHPARGVSDETKRRHFRTVRSIRPVMAVALAAIFFARKWPAGKRRLQFIAAFRAGRKFYHSYPHIAKDIAYGDRPWQKLDVYWPPDPGPALGRGERLP